MVKTDLINPGTMDTESNQNVTTGCLPNFTQDSPAGCRPCALCAHNAHVKRPCSATADTRCECNRDYYWDLARGQCSQCDLCPHGWGAMRACAPHRNSACRKCPPGTYSSVLSTSLACFPCSTCKSHQLVVQQCDQIQDTVCMDSSDMNTDDISQLKVLPKSEDPSKSHEYLNYSEQDHSIWPIYCALLGALVLALVIYVVLKRWRFNAPHQRHGRHLYTRQPTVPIKQATDFPFVDVCATKRRTLEMLLNEPRADFKDWRGLAKELGYRPEKVLQLESRSRLKFGYDCSKHLLSDWSRREGATIASLLLALHRLGNMDAIYVVLSNSCCNGSCSGGGRTDKSNKVIHQHPLGDMV